MSYDVLILVLLILAFCFFTMMFTVNVLFSMFNAVKPDDIPEIKPLKLPKRTPKKSNFDLEQEADRRRYETIMRNLEAYDGTEIGQEEVK